MCILHGRRPFRPRTAPLSLSSPPRGRPEASGLSSGHPTAGPTRSASPRPRVGLPPFSLARGRGGAEERRAVVVVIGAGRAAGRSRSSGPCRPRTPRARRPPPPRPCPPPPPPPPQARSSPAGSGLCLRPGAVDSGWSVGQAVRRSGGAGPLGQSARRPRGAEERRPDDGRRHKFPVADGTGNTAAGQLGGPAVPTVSTTRHCRPRRAATARLRRPWPPALPRGLHRDAPQGGRTSAAQAASTRSSTSGRCSGASGGGAMRGPGGAARPPREVRTCRGAPSCFWRTSRNRTKRGALGGADASACAL